MTAQLQQDSSGFSSHWKLICDLEMASEIIECRVRAINQPNVNAVGLWEETGETGKKHAQACGEHEARAAKLQLDRVLGIHI